MNRRSFISSAAAAGLGVLPLAAQTDGDKSAAYYEFRFHRMTQGDRPGKLAAAYQRMLPLFEKHKIGPVGFFNVTIGPDSPVSLVLLPWNSMAERDELLGAVAREPESVKIHADLESGAEPPVDYVDSFMAQAAAFSPALKASPAQQKPRLFELRVYHSPTQRQLVALAERFGGPEIKIFHRSGIFPVLYGYTVIGRNMPNLVYLIPFDSLAAREKAWATFGADPEWRKVRDESVQKAGNIVSNVSITLLQAAAFSAIR